jgi:hypothetical protein
MDNKATRPQKVPSKPLPPVSKPDTSGTENKYARKRMIGPPKAKNVVDSIGLGNLKVETTYGKPDHN